MNEKKKRIYYNDTLVPDPEIRALAQRLRERLAETDDIDIIHQIDFIAIDLAIETREKMIRMLEQKKEKEED